MIQVDPRGDASLFPLEVEVVETRSAARGLEFIATSRQWPGLRADGESVGEAVDRLHAEIEGHRPLDAATREALAELGGRDLVDAWDRHVCGWRCAEVRNLGAQVAEELGRFHALGIPLVEACVWIGLRVTLSYIPTAREHDIAPPEFVAYLDQYTGATGGFWGARGGVLPGPLDWIVAGVPLDRALVYEKFVVLLDEAGEVWEPLVEKTAMPVERLRSYLEAKVPADEVVQRERDIASGDRGQD